MVALWLYCGSTVVVRWYYGGTVVVLWQYTLLRPVQSGKMSPTLYESGEARFASGDVLFST